MSAPALELLAIGNELLLGETVDTNSAWIAQRLAREGITVARKTTVGDDVALIRDALHDALRRHRTVICTGGLGPTVDDLTRHALAELYGRRIVVDEGWVDTLRDRYARRGLVMPEINRVQGEHPEGATLLPNARGTAPGIVMDNPALGMSVLLPGVPGEMRGLMDDAVVAIMRERLRPAAPLVLRTLRTAGITEAALAERVADIAAHTGSIALAFLPHTTGVDLRLSCPATEEPALDELAGRLRARIGVSVYADQQGRDIAAVVGDLLREQGLTVALAESCTGGLVAKRLTDVPGSSAWVHSAFMTYANESKVALLGVRQQTLDDHGAVSEACACEMALGARERAGADVGIAITGIAGPSGGTADKPVGTTWIAVVLPGRAPHARRFILAGDRDQIRQRAAQASLDLLRRLLLDQHD